MNLWRRLVACIRVAALVDRETPGDLCLFLEASKLGIQLAEGLGPGRGGEKKKLALRIAMQSVRLKYTLDGHEPMDEGKIYSQLADLVDTLVRYYNEGKYENHSAANQ